MAKPDAFIATLGFETVSVPLVSCTGVVGQFCPDGFIDT
jgi:hypothetical protein